MLEHRTIAKKLLKKSSRSNYFEIVNEGKLSPEEERIINARFLDKKLINEIADEENCSEKRIKDIISNAYDRVYELLYD